MTTDIRTPAIKVVEQIVKDCHLEGGLLITFDRVCPSGGKVRLTSYGIDRKRCEEVARIGDTLMDWIVNGEVEVR